MSEQGAVKEVAIEPNRKTRGFKPARAQGLQALTKGNVPLDS